MGRPEDVPHNQYLQQRGRTWYVRVIVPPSLRATIGKQHRLKSLGTTDVVEARERRWAVLAEIRREFQELRGAKAWDPIKMDLEWRPIYRAADPEPQGDGDPRDTEREDVRYYVVDEVDELRAAGRDDDAALLYRVVTSDDAVLSEAGERWLKELVGRHTEQTISQHRLAFARLREAYPEAVLAGDIDRRKAGRFASEFLVGKKG
jgi:hypothetical protein